MPGGDRNPENAGPPTSTGGQERERRIVRVSPTRLDPQCNSAVRHALDPDQDLVPFPDLVEQRYQGWLLEKESGRAMLAPQGGGPSP